MTVHKTRFPMRVALAATFVLSALAISLTVVRPASAGTTYDLAADWSDLMNPNGTWSYNDGAGAPIGVHTSDWCPGCFVGGAAQPAWAYVRQPDGFGHIPVWFKTVQAAASSLDFPLGRVVMHAPDPFNAFTDTPATVTWTSPIVGEIQVSGGVWLARKIGRSVHWKLRVNGAEITSGNLTSGDPFTSGNTFDLATGSGGAAALTLSVLVGDVVGLELGRTSPAGEFVGIDLTIIQLDTDLEQATRDLAVEILALDLGLFNGPNNNANNGRRKSLANRATEAADAIALGDIEGAIGSLNSLLDKIDGQTPPPDWMDSSPEQQQLAADVQALIDDLLLLL